MAAQTITLTKGYKTMKNLDTIVDRVIKISEDYEFIKENFYCLNEENFQYARIIYANLPNGRLFIDGYIDTQDSFTEHEKAGEDFKLFLLYAQPKTFNELVVIMTIYPSLIYGDHVLPFLPLKPFPSQSLGVDEILCESNGHLVWVYQLEKLIGLFEPNTASIADRVKAVRIKDPAIFEWMATKFVCNGLTLKDVVEKRTLLAGVYRPRMHAAFRLYRLLFTDELI